MIPPIQKHGIGGADVKRANSRQEIGYMIYYMSYPIIDKHPDIASIRNRSEDGSKRKERG
jgi:hypothetical protein